jgi:transcriptional regulator with XRE-family HTH domain
MRVKSLFVLVFVWANIKRGGVILNVLEKIKMLQREKNWSSLRLSKEAELPPSTISTLYQRNHQPTIPTLQSICNAFDITLSQFFSDSHLPLDLTPEQLKLITSWNKLTDKQKSAVLTLIENLT